MHYRFLSVLLLLSLSLAGVLHDGSGPRGLASRPGSPDSVTAPPAESHDSDEASRHSSASPLGLRDARFKRDLEALLRREHDGRPVRRAAPIVLYGAPGSPKSPKDLRGERPPPPPPKDAKPPLNAPDAKGNSQPFKCKGSVCTKDEMKIVLAQQAEKKKHMKFECKTLADCKCPKSGPGSEFGGSCFNNQCLCGDKNKKIANVATGFAKPVMEGIAIVGKEAEKILGPMTVAIKTIIKLGTWLIPGLPAVAKGVAKALDAAIPPVTLGDKKADQIVDIVQKVL